LSELADVEKKLDNEQDARQLVNIHSVTLGPYVPNCLIRHSLTVTV